jgi:hypothetical protein
MWKMKCGFAHFKAQTWSIPALPTCVQRLSLMDKTHNKLQRMRDWQSTQKREPNFGERLVSVQRNHVAAGSDAVVCAAAKMLHTYNTYKTSKETCQTSRETYYSTATILTSNTMATQQTINIRKCTTPGAKQLAGALAQRSVSSSSSTLCLSVRHTQGSGLGCWRGFHMGGPQKRPKPTLGGAARTVVAVVAGAVCIYVYGSV